MKCNACKKCINQKITGEPYLVFKNITLCSDCYISIIEPIYNMAGVGDGGIISLIFAELTQKKDG